MLPGLTHPNSAVAVALCLSLLSLQFLTNACQKAEPKAQEPEQVVECDPEPHQIDWNRAESLQTLLATTAQGVGVFDFGREKSDKDGSVLDFAEFAHPECIVTLEVNAPWDVTSFDAISTFPKLERLQLTVDDMMSPDAALQAPLLNWLDITTWGAGPPRLFLHRELLPQLTTLKLAKVDMNDLTESELLDSLTYLWLGGVKLDSRTLSIDSPTLKHLFIISPVDLDLMQITSAPSLEFLQVSDRGLALEFPAEEVLESLLALSLNYRDSVDFAQLQLHTVAPALESVGVQDSNVESLSGLELTNVRSLSLSRAVLPADLSPLEQMPKLRRLTISRNPQGEILETAERLRARGVQITYG